MKKRNRFTSFLLLLITLVTMLGSTITVFADEVSAKEAMDRLRTQIKKGSYTSVNFDIDVADKVYKSSGGGYIAYGSLTTGPADTEQFFLANTYSKLTSSGKQQFLEDILEIANAMVYDTDNGVGSTDYPLGSGVTSDTLDDMFDILQNKAGMGAQVLAAVMKDAKPNFAKASNMLSPFNGVVGTVLGVISIVTISLLGFSVGLDILVIAVPPIQLAVLGEGAGGGGSGSQEGHTSALAKIVSVEARRAIAESEGGGSGGSNGNQGGKFKSPIIGYLGKKWISLACIFIAILYLVSGSLYTLIVQVIDLFSGFLGL